MVRNYKDFLENNKISKNYCAIGLRVVDFDTNGKFVLLEDLDTKYQRRLALTYLFVSVENKTFWLSNPSKLKNKI